MASRLQCRACGRVNVFGDKQPMRKFCDDECERVWKWLHERREVAEAEEDLDPKARKALSRCRQLLLLAVDGGTLEDERRTAATQVCKLLARHGFLEIVDRASERFTPEDFVRWAEKVGRERGGGRAR